MKTKGILTEYLNTAMKKFLQKSCNEIKFDNFTQIISKEVNKYQFSMSNFNLINQTKHVTSKETEEIKNLAKIQHIKLEKGR